MSVGSVSFNKVQAKLVLRRDILKNWTEVGGKSLLHFSSATAMHEAPVVSKYY